MTVFIRLVEIECQTILFISSSDCLRRKYFFIYITHPHTDTELKTLCHEKMDGEGRKYNNYLKFREDLCEGTWLIL